MPDREPAPRIEAPCRMLGEAAEFGRAAEAAEVSPMAALPERCDTLFLASAGQQKTDRWMRTNASRR